MPEGPDILISTQFLESKIRNKNIIDIKILGGRYTHQKLKGLDLLKNKPLKVSSIDSKGKFLWMTLNDSEGSPIYMMNTFGMTGRWSFIFSSNARIEINIQSKSNKDKTYSLYYVDPRNFGTIEFTNNKQTLQKRIDLLAPDLLRSNISDIELVEQLKKFRQRFRGDKNMVKILMNQNSIVSGIGNYLVAEILYEAKLNPHRSLDTLTDKELYKLAHSMRKIIKLVYYDNTAEYTDRHYNTFMKTRYTKIDNGILPNFHPDIIGDSRNGFEFKVYQRSSDPYGNLVLTDEIVKGRKIHWVQKIQV
jgi:formamidopyrimidine-DNA glycosylase